MNRRASDPGAVIGDFGGARLEYGGGTATFTRDANGFAMELAPSKAAARRFAITRTIGSRYLQEYVGVEVSGPEPPGDPVYAREIRLPFGWWVRAGRWLPRAYFDSWYGGEYAPDGSIANDPFVPDRDAWATRCAWCHNTYPFEVRLVRANARDVGHGLEQWFSLARDGRSAASRAAIANDNLLPVDELVTIGISCESCHLGGREHAARPRTVKPRFVPGSPDVIARAGAPDLEGGRHNAVVVDAICAQCHSTPSPRYPNGAAVRNSTEALDLLAGACVPSIKCTDCHDPHTAGAGPGAADPPTALAACTRCHRDLAEPSAVSRHTRHASGSASCLDCHMPRIVAGVSSFVRSHRISSPSDPVMLAAGAPNACNLCHLDRSIAWTVRELDRGWGAHLAPDATWRASYGDLDAAIGPAWLASASGQIRITAAAAYARSPLGRAALASLELLLEDPDAYDRMWSLFAVEDVLGRRLKPAELDPLADQTTRARQVEALRQR
jgi:predicted CXXCH cytochrome family protein